MLDVKPVCACRMAMSFVNPGVSHLCVQQSSKSTQLVLAAQHVVDAWASWEKSEMSPKCGQMAANSASAWKMAKSLA